MSSHRLRPSAEMKTETARKAFVKLLLVACVCTPPALSLSFVIKTGIESYFLDDFAYIPMFELFENGILPVKEIFGFHNEHRAFFANLILIFMGKLTHFSTLPELYSCFFLTVGILGFYFIVLRKVFSTNKALLALVPLSAIIFCMRNYESFYYGNLMFSTFTVLAALIALYALSSFKGNAGKKNFIIAIVASFVASFSLFGGGMATWPTGLFILLCKLFFENTEFRFGTIFRANRTYILVWCLCAAAAVVMYYGEGLPASTPAKERLPHLLTHDPQFVARFFLMLLDSAITSNAWFLAAYAMIALTLFSIFQMLKVTVSRNQSSIVDGRHDLFYFGAALLLFGLLNSMLITFGRAPLLDLKYATAPRYLQWTEFLLIGPYLMGLAFKQPAQSRRILIWAPLILIAISFASGILLEITLEPTICNLQRTRAYVLSSYKQQSDKTIAELLPDVKRARIFAGVLENRKWSVFANLPDPTILPRSKSRQEYRLTEINQPTQADGTVTLDRKKNPDCILKLWAYDTSSGKPSSQVYLRVDNRLLRTMPGQETPELLKATHRKQLAHSGFFLRFDGNIFKTGKYPAGLVIVDSKGKSAYFSDSICTLVVQ